MFQQMVSLTNPHPTVTTSVLTLEVTRRINQRKSGVKNFESSANPAQAIQNNISHHIHTPTKQSKKMGSTLNFFLSLA